MSAAGSSRLASRGLPPDSPIWCSPTDTATGDGSAPNGAPRPASPAPLRAPLATACCTLVMVLALAAPAFAQTTTVIDGPQANATVGQPFSIYGWSVQLGAPSGTGVDVVHIQGCPTANCGTPTFWGAATYGSARPDIGAAYGSQYTNSGYSFLMSGLAPGEYRAEVWAHSTVTNGWYMTPVTFTVTATPFHVLEAPTTNQGVTQPFTMSGWAIDASAPTGTGVDAIDLRAYWNYGNGTPEYWLGVATYGGSRPDVAAAYGSRFQPSGYTRTIAWQQAGWYWFMVSSHNTASNTWTTVTRTAFVDIPTSDLTVTRTGTGTGAITATGTTGAGLNCPGGSTTQAVPCPTLTQATGTVVTITAVPDAGSTFAGWTGGCSGADPCAVTLNGNRHATAVFAKVPGTFDVSYYHTDVIGSVRAITDDAGATVIRHDYAPFGEDSLPLTGDPYRFAGKELDAETGLNYFAARYYRNTWGRFTTVDPVLVDDAMLDPQQWNRYAYARNNPLAYVDPTGEFSINIFKSLISPSFWRNLFAGRSRSSRAIAAGAAFTWAMTARRSSRGQDSDDDSNPRSDPNRPTDGTARPRPGGDQAPPPPPIPEGGWQPPPPGPFPTDGPSDGPVPTRGASGGDSDEPPSNNCTSGDLFCQLAADIAGRTGFLTKPSTYVYFYGASAVGGGAGAVGRILWTTGQIEAGGFVVRSTMHPAHHTFRFLGRQPHWQVNTFRLGVKKSDRAFRVPVSERFYQWWIRTFR